MIGDPNFCGTCRHFEWPMNARGDRRYDCKGRCFALNGMADCTKGGVPVRRTAGATCDMWKEIRS